MSSVYFLSCCWKLPCTNTTTTTTTITLVIIPGFFYRKSSAFCILTLWNRNFEILFPDIISKFSSHLDHQGFRAPSFRGPTGRQRVLSPTPWIIYTFGYICYLVLGYEPMAVVQYTFIQNNNTHNNTIIRKTQYGTYQKKKEEKDPSNYKKITSEKYVALHYGPAQTEIFYT